jgi:hypothetical protein
MYSVCVTSGVGEHSGLPASSYGGGGVVLLGQVANVLYAILFDGIHIRRVKFTDLLVKFR